MQSILRECKRCKGALVLGCFSKKKHSADGINPWCKECVTVYNKEWKAAHPGYMKEYNLLNKDRIAESHKEWFEKNWEEYARKNNEHRKLRRIQDPAFRIRCNLRTRISKLFARVMKRFVEGSKKAGSAVKDCGCSMEFLKEYIESLWTVGMSWENYGLQGWHIDHVIPLYVFDLTNREQFLKACNYTNLQPLWWHDNLGKRATDIGKHGPWSQEPSFSIS